jgi:hypothetical protein
MAKVIDSATLYRWREAVLDVVPAQQPHDDGCPEDDTCECDLSQPNLDAIADEMLEAYLDAIREDSKCA